MASCVPYLELDNLPVDLKTEGSELHSDGNLVLSLELVIHYSLHQARLSDTSVTDDDELEEVILRCQRLVRNDLVCQVGKRLIIRCLLHFNYFVS